MKHGGFGRWLRMVNPPRQFGGTKGSDIILARNRGGNGQLPYGSGPINSPSRWGKGGVREGNPSTKSGVNTTARNGTDSRSGEITPFLEKEADDIEISQARCKTLRQQPVHINGFLRRKPPYFYGSEGKVPFWTRAMFGP